VSFITLLDQIVSTMALDITVAFDTTAAFVIPLVTQLTSSPVMWRKEHPWNFRVLQRVHFFNLLIIPAVVKHLNKMTDFIFIISNHSNILVSVMQFVLTHCNQTTQFTP
jgi:hypothetical protein